MLFLGLCPAIAVAVRVIDALWMSAGVILVLVLSDLAMSLLARGGGRRQSGDSAGVTARGLLRALVITSFLTASLRSRCFWRAPRRPAHHWASMRRSIAVNCLVLGQGLPGVTKAGRRCLRDYGIRQGPEVRRWRSFSLPWCGRCSGAGTVTLFPVGGFGGTIEVHRLVDQPVRALGFAGGGLLCLGYLAAAARAIASRVESRDARRESSR